MKMRTLFSIALAGLMLGSCSKDVVNGDGGASWNENGTGFISLALNLPTTSGSRAASFDDGEGEEYEVKDAILVLFTGDNENDAEFHSAYNLGLGNWENEISDQITTSARIVQEINEITGSNNVYALVVLNPNGVISVQEGAQLKVYNSDDNFNGTLAGLNGAIASIAYGNHVWNNSSFLMSNAPLYTEKGGNRSSDPNGSGYTLVKIERNSICSTEAEAIANPSASIYVERAQAKIQVKDGSKNEDGGNGTFNITNKNGAIVTYNYALTGWDIDNYNNHSRLTRNFKNEWAKYTSEKNSWYRFVDRYPVEDGAHYRTHWGEDVNYITVTTAYQGSPALVAVAKTPVDGNIPDLSKKMGEYTYCFENTTEVVPAKGLDATRVIISAKLGKGTDDAADFFTVNGDRHTIYLNDDSDASIKNRIKEFVLGVQSVQEAVRTNVLSGNFSDENITVTIVLPSVSGVMSNTNITVEIDTDNDVSYNVGGENSIKNAIELALQNADEDNGAANRFILDYYKGGVCYYQAFIRHFDDTETPWNKDNNQSENASKYLGRYGVLRNNWYVLNINSINNIGDSTCPELPVDPIDEEEFYLSVDINIMPWAKREQNVDL